jgi:hypothetical protein
MGIEGGTAIVLAFLLVSIGVIVAFLLAGSWLDGSWDGGAKAVLDGAERSNYRAALAVLDSGALLAIFYVTAAVAVRFDYSPATDNASRTTHQIGRKRLTACKLCLKLGGLPDIAEPLPPKPKWKHKKRYHDLRNHVQALETKAICFRKETDVRTFAYYV